MQMIMLLVLLVVPLSGIVADSARAEDNSSAGAVYVVPVKQTVQSGLMSFMKRVFQEAEEAKASLIVLDIDTPGGQLKTAEDIGLLIRESKVPTVAFVSGKAASAGAYIALNAGGIAMAPGSTIGAAMIVDGAGNAVESPKLVSFWSAEMKSVAEMNGRDPEIAVGMVDPSRVVELKAIGKTNQAGEIVSLSAEEAFKVGYSDHQARTVAEVIAWKGLSDRMIIQIKPTIAEQVSSFLTSPGIATLLLIIGIAGIVIEMLVPGFGVPGITGLVAFILYFFGQSIAGFAGNESLVVFILGIGLLLLEAFVPSFGILGILGIISVIAGITMGAYDTGDALKSLGIAALVATAVVVAFVYVFRRRGVWNRFILSEQLTAEKGYLPQEKSRDNWIGQVGITTSLLRPSGMAEFDGQRLDVITSGEYLEKGTKVTVVSVDGTRIVVKEI